MGSNRRCEVWHKSAVFQHLFDLVLTVSCPKKTPLLCGSCGNFMTIESSPVISDHHGSYTFTNESCFRTHSDAYVIGHSCMSFCSISAYLLQGGCSVSCHPCNEIQSCTPSCFLNEGLSSQLAFCNSIYSGRQFWSSLIEPKIFHIRRCQWLSYGSHCHQFSFVRCCFWLVFISNFNEATLTTFLQQTEGRPPGQWRHWAMQLPAKKNSFQPLIFRRACREDLTPYTWRIIPGRT